MNVKSLIDRLDLSVFRRVPQRIQTESAECGITCLSMIAAYYGKDHDLFSLRQQYGSSSRGETLLSLAEIAKRMHLNSRALSLDLDETDSLRMPAILHWGFNHFVVLVKKQRNKYIIHDPATGRRIVSEHEISAHFTGIALELWPDNEFKAEKSYQTLKLRTLLKNVQGIKSALLKIFMLSLVIEAINLLIPVGTQLVMDHVITAADHGLLSIICLGLLFVIVLQRFTGLIRSFTALMMSSLIEVQWKSGLFSHLISLPLNYFEKRRLGDIHSRFHSLDTLCELFTQHIVKVVVDGILFVGLLTMMFVYSTSLTWVVLIFTALYIALRYFAYPAYRHLSEEILVKEAWVNSHFMETLYGIATIKSQGLGAFREKNWSNMVIDNTNSHIRLSRMNFFFHGTQIFLTSCDQIAILWLGAMQVIDSQLTIGMFIAFSVYRTQFADRVASLVDTLFQLRIINLHTQRIADVALAEPDEREGARTTTRLRDKQGQPLTLEVRNLAYTYHQREEAVFQDISFRVEAGESVAITGVSGSGKTTLMKVICGLFAPTKGSVLVEGIDLASVKLGQYQQLIATVLQDDKLFSGSVRDNIAGFSAEVDMQFVEECAKNSAIHDEIMKLPMGYETLIGELGDGLSGGQKQRLFIARALYHRPGILFMDEATSHLDQQSERKVNEAIKQLKITRVIIAHRQSTIDSADRVIVLPER